MNGWLSPTAEFFPCAIGDHYKKAQELMEDGSKVPAETWVMIYRVGAFTELPLTQAQIEWLKKSLDTNKDECYQGIVEDLLENQADWGKLRK